MFLVFAGNYYYPYGGWDDLRDTYNTLEEAKQSVIAAAEKSDKWCYQLEWVQIVSLEKREITITAEVAWDCGLCKNIVVFKENEE